MLFGVWWTVAVWYLSILLNVIYFNVTELALGQTYDFLGHSKTTLKNKDEQIT